MGNCCLPIRFRRTSSAVNPKNLTLLLVGLDNSGKTTIAKRLAGEPIDAVVPTVGFSVILLRQRGCNVSVYDLGGGPQIRDIWPRYYADAHGVIFVTDARDTDRMTECRQVLEKLLQSDQISGKPVLLLANKQDMEGALDEIDIVDRLNLEKLVNEQKCPTLVELCSALNFTKRIDIGIENGYKWLIRTIIRDYPSLNNRVVRDLAAQEEENKVQIIKRHSRGEERDVIVNYVEVKPKRILEEKVQANGVPKMRVATHMIPGLIEELPEGLKERKNHIHKLTGDEIPGGESPIKSNSYSSEFFILERFQSDVELLNDVANHSFKNFLVRPKSSGARLYGVKTGSVEITYRGYFNGFGSNIDSLGLIPEKKRTQRRKALKKGNKTRPSPFTDIAVPNPTEEENVRSPAEDGKENPFLVSNRSKDGRRTEGWEMNAFVVSKSMPNSRRNSVGRGKGRRHSEANGKRASLPNAATSLPSAKEILLDVSRLDGR